MHDHRIIWVKSGKAWSRYMRMIEAMRHNPQHPAAKPTSKIPQLKTPED